MPPTLELSHAVFLQRLRKQSLHIQMDAWATLAEFRRLGDTGKVPPTTLAEQRRWRRVTWLLWIAILLTTTWLSTAWICWAIVGAILLEDALFQHTHRIVFQQAVQDPGYYAARIAAKTLRLHPRRRHSTPAPQRRTHPMSDPSTIRHPLTKEALVHLRTSPSAVAQHLNPALTGVLWPRQRRAPVSIATLCEIVLTTAYAEQAGKVTELQDYLKSKGLVHPTGAAA
jgi:hypothetical protein